jgi:hypothetical protein
MKNLNLNFGGKPGSQIFMAVAASVAVSHLPVKSL